MIEKYQLLYLSIFLFSVGILGSLIRNTLPHILISLHVSFIGVFLLFACDANPGSAGIAVIISALLAAQTVGGSAAIIFVYRERATIEVDSLRESRG